MLAQIPLELQSTTFELLFGKLLDFPPYFYQRAIVVPRRRTAQAAAVKAHLAHIAKLAAEGEDPSKAEEVEARAASPTPSTESDLSVVSYASGSSVSSLASSSFAIKSRASSTTSALSLTKIARVQSLKASATTEVSKVTAQARFCEAPTRFKSRRSAWYEALPRKNDHFVFALEEEDLEDAQALTAGDIEARMV